MFLVLSNYDLFTASDLPVWYRLVIGQAMTNFDSTYSNDNRYNFLTLNYKSLCICALSDLVTACTPQGASYVRHNDTARTL